MADDFFLPRHHPTRTLKELALHRWNLKVSCHSCPHARVFQGHELWWLFEQRRWDDSLELIARRFWCSQCFMRSPKKVRFPRCEKTKDEPTGDPLPEPDERAWKKVVSRYRC